MPYAHYRTTADVLEGKSAVSAAQDIPSATRFTAAKEHKVLVAALKTASDRPYSHVPRTMVTARSKHVADVVAAGQKRKRRAEGMS
jgi:hypothetical protein